MKRILFLCGNNGFRSRMAAYLAEARAIKGLKIETAGIMAGELSDDAVTVIEENGFKVASRKGVLLKSILDHDFNVVIAVCDEAAKECPVLPGNPERVNWNLPDPYAGSDKDRIERLRASAKLIRQLVDDFFDRGYLTSLVDAKATAELVLNNISDGVIAHDMNRRLFYFNRAAEQITGYSRGEVLNRDCHDVFPGKFCGSKCHFCEGDIPAVDSIRQEMQLVTKSGEHRVVEMWIRKMEDLNDQPVGVLASFRDVTKERRLAREVGQIRSFSGIIGRNYRMLEVYDLIKDLADSDVPVLIQGESGTGKELVAAAIHNEGSRSDGLFVPVNCGALPESLLESELFGHVKGAFTGAIRDKKGRFELADKGTIFLDEIGDISPAMQVRLLRVLQEGTFERVGSEHTIKVNVRVISATNKDIAVEISKGNFREDLFYRLNVVPLFLPPLRERRNDIPLLAEHILNFELERTDRKGITISAEAMDVMMAHDWPGNVRELQNWLQFALVKCKQGEIGTDHLPPSAGRNLVAREPSRKRRRRKLDITGVQQALRATGGNKLEAAQKLGVSRATLYRFLDDAGME